MVKLNYDCNWRKLITEESGFLYEYNNMTEVEISDKIDKEINCESNRCKEIQIPTKVFDSTTKALLLFTVARAFIP